MQQIVCEFCWHGGAHVRVFGMPICDTCRLAAIEWIKDEFGFESHPITDELMDMVTPDWAVERRRDFYQQRMARVQKRFARKP